MSKNVSEKVTEKMSTAGVQASENVPQLSDSEMLSKILDEYMVHLEGHVPELKDSNLKKKLRESLNDLLTNFDTAAMKDLATIEIKKVTERVSEAGASKASKRSVVAAPNPALYLVLAEIIKENEDATKKVYDEFRDEMIPVIKKNGIETAKNISRETLLLVFQFVAKKVKEQVIPPLVDLIGSTVLTELKGEPELEQLVTEFVSNILEIVPIILNGKSIKDDYACMIKDFAKRAFRMVAKAKVQELDDGTVDVKHVEKMFDIVLQLSYNMIMKVVMGDTPACEVAGPALKTALRLMADVIPENDS